MPMTPDELKAFTTRMRQLLLDDPSISPADLDRRLGGSGHEASVRLVVTSDLFRMKLLEEARERSSFLEMQLDLVLRFPPWSDGSPYSADELRRAGEKYGEAYREQYGR